jgi:hypothetical protein
MAIADALRTDDVRPAAEQADRGDLHVATPAAEVDTLVDEEPHAPVHSLKEARDRRAMEQLSLTDEPAAPATEAPRAVEQDTEHEVEDDLAEDEGHVAVPDTVGPRKKRPERRRVPSWDEIMFGGRQD